MTILEKFSIAQKNNLPANCIGTALFVAGLSDQDVVVSSLKFYINHQQRLRRVVRPTICDLVSWEVVKDSSFFDKQDPENDLFQEASFYFKMIDRNGIAIERFCRHLAVVLRTNPLELMTRNGCYFDITGHYEIPGNGENAFPKIQTFEELNASYYEDGMEVSFYRY